MGSDTDGSDFDKKEAISSLDILLSTRFRKYGRLNGHVDTPPSGVSSVGAPLAAPSWAGQALPLQSRRIVIIKVLGAYVTEFMKKSTKKGRVTVPHPKRDMTIRTIKSIEKQSGLSLL